MITTEQTPSLLDETDVPTKEPIQTLDQGLEATDTRPDFITQPVEDRKTSKPTTLGTILAYADENVDKTFPEKQAEYTDKLKVLNNTEVVGEVADPIRNQSIEEEMQAAYISARKAQLGAVEASVRSIQELKEVSTAPNRKLVDDLLVIHDRITSTNAAESGNPITVGTIKDIDNQVRGMTAAQILEMVAGDAQKKLSFNSISEGLGSVVEVGDAVFNFFTPLFGVRTSVPMANRLQKWVGITTDEVAQGDYANTVQAVRQRLAGLTPEQYDQAVRELITVVRQDEDVRDNALIQGIILSEILSDSMAGVNFNNITDIATVPLDLIGIAGLLKGGYKLAKATRTMAMLNPKRASAAIAETIKLDAPLDAANALDLTKEDALEAMISFKVDSVMSSGLSDSLGLTKESIRASVKTFYENTLSALHSSGVAEKEALAYANELARLKYSPDVDPDLVGFKVLNVDNRGITGVVLRKVMSEEEGLRAVEEGRKLGRNMVLIQGTPNPNATADVNVLKNKVAALKKEAELRKSRLSVNAYAEDTDEVAGNQALKDLWIAEDEAGAPVYYPELGRDYISAGDILSVISDSSKTASNKSLAKYLLEFDIDWDNIKINRLRTEDDWQAAFKHETGLDATKEPAKYARFRGTDKPGTGISGFYSAKNDQIYLRGSMMRSEDLALHEILHAHISQTLDAILLGTAASKFKPAQVKAAKNLQAIYDAVIAHGIKLYDDADTAEGVMYGFRDVHEMISEAFTDPTFRHFLSTIKPSSKLQELLGTKVGSMMDALIKTVGKMLGFKDDNVLTAIMREYDKLATGITESKRTLETTSVAMFAKREAKDNMSQLKSAYRRIAALEEEIALAEAEATAGKTGTWYVREIVNEVVPMDRISGFAQEDIMSAYSKLWFGAEAWLDPRHATSEFVYQTRLLGIHERSNLANNAANFIKEGTKGLNKGQLKRIEDILTEGDEFIDPVTNAGRDFTASEVLDRIMVTDPKGRLIFKNEKQRDQMVEAYFRVRTARNIMWDMRNEAMARSLTADGFKHVIIGFGSKADSFVTAGRHLQIDDVPTNKIVYNSLTNSRMTLDETNKANAKASGFHVIQTRERYVTADGKEYTHILVSPENTKSQDIYHVLGKRDGTFSRMYTDEYFLRANRTIEIDGEQVAKVGKDGLHFATARTSREAEQYVSAFNDLLRRYRTNPADVTIDVINKRFNGLEDGEDFLRRLQAGEFADYTETGGKFIDFHYNRNSSDYVNTLLDFTASTGKMFVDKRGEKLRAIGDRLPSMKNTVSPFESIQKEINNVSNFVSTNDWKQASIQRWYNHMYDHLPSNVQKMSPVDAFMAMRQNPNAYIGNEDVVHFGNRVSDYVANQVSFSTGEQIRERAAIREMTEWAEKVVHNRIPSLTTPVEAVGRFLRTADPVSFLKTVTFHSALGVWNPAQFFVQAAGATTAVALHPVHGLAAASAAMVYRLALMSDNPSVIKHLFKHNSSLLGKMAIEDFEETVTAIKRSGILENTRSTSLYNLEDGQFNIFSHGIGGTARSILDTSAGFFNRGEEFSRLIAFDVARRIYKKANPTANILEDTHLAKILNQADDFTQNMTRANQAAYQHGWASIPTQFMQYPIKLTTNVGSAFTSAMLKKPHRGFTPKEAAALIAGNAILFGSGIATYATEKLVGEEASNSEVQLYMREGFIAGAINSVYKAFTDEKLELGIGTRLSPYSFAGEIWQTLTEKSFLDMYAGASMSTLQRADKIANIFSIIASKEGTLTADEVLTGFQNASSHLSSSLSNATKAYLAFNNNNIVTSNGGANLYRASNAELVALALGIAPAQQADINRIYEARKDHMSVLKETADAVSYYTRQYSRDMNMGKTEEAMASLATAKSLMAKVSRGDYKTVEGLVRKQIGSDDQTITLLEKYLYETMELPTTSMEKPGIVTKSIKESQEGRTR